MKEMSAPRETSDRGGRRVDGRKVSRDQGGDRRQCDWRKEREKDKRTEGGGGGVRASVGTYRTDFMLRPRSLGCDMMYWDWSTCTMWLIRIFDSTHSYVLRHIFTCVTRLNFTCDMAHPHV